jgi:hypothetical protein
MRVGAVYFHYGDSALNWMGLDQGVDRPQAKLLFDDLGGENCTAGSALKLLFAQFSCLAASAFAQLVKQSRRECCAMTVHYSSEKERRFPCSLGNTSVQRDSATNQQPMRWSHSGSNPRRKIMARNHTNASQARELTEAELDAVSGGFFGFYLGGPTTTTTSGIRGESKDDKHPST